MWEKIKKLFADRLVWVRQILVAGLAGAVSWQVGDLLIESGGQDGQQTFTDIAQPERVQNIIHSTIQARGAGRADATPGSMSIAGEIERLEALRDRGTISDDEFLEQKRRLLN